MYNYRSVCFMFDVGPFVIVMCVFDVGCFMYNYSRVCFSFMFDVARLLSVMCVKNLRNNMTCGDFLFLIYML